MKKQVRQSYVWLSGMLLTVSVLFYLTLQNVNVLAQTADPTLDAFVSRAQTATAAAMATAGILPTATEVPEFGDPVQTLVIYNADSLTIVVPEQTISTASLEGITIYVPETGRSIQLESYFGRLDRTAVPSCFFISVGDQGIPSAECFAVGAEGFLTRSIAQRDVLWYDPNTRQQFPIEIRRGSTVMGTCNNFDQDCNVVYVPPAPELDPAADLQIHDTQTNPITESRVCVETGEQVAIRAEGVYTVGEFVGETDADGPLNSMWDNQIVRDSYNLDGYTNLPHGALLYRIGENSDWQPCNCTEERIITATAAGCLQFTVNDKSPADNAGEVSIEITKLN